MTTDLVLFLPLVLYLLAEWQIALTAGLKVGPGRKGRRPGTLWFAGSIPGLLFTLL